MGLISGSTLALFYTNSFFRQYETIYPGYYSGYYSGINNSPGKAY